MMAEDDDFIAQLEALGEAEVRRLLAKGVYGTTGHKRPMVEAWLESKVQSRNDVANLEIRRIARSAKNAAWTAAIAAIISAIFAAIVWNSS